MTQHKLEQAESALEFPDVSLHGNGNGSDWVMPGKLIPAGFKQGRASSLTDMGHQEVTRNAGIYSKSLNKPGGGQLCRSGFHTRHHGCKGCRDWNPDLLIEKLRSGEFML